MKGITKAGNTRSRKVLLESANAISKSNPYKKSKRLLMRQKGMDPSVIDYADRGSSRIKKKYSKMKRAGKNQNNVKTACARELACFIWGMMTGSMERA